MPDQKMNSAPKASSARIWPTISQGDPLHLHASVKLFFLFVESGKRRWISMERLLSECFTCNWFLPGGREWPDSQTRETKNPSRRRGREPLFAPLEPHRPRYRAGFGTLAATPGCRVVIGPLPSHHSRCYDYVSLSCLGSFLLRKIQLVIGNLYHNSGIFVNDFQKICGLSYGRTTLDSSR
jgi:hypothetical protein